MMVQFRRIPLLLILTVVAVAFPAGAEDGAAPGKGPADGDGTPAAEAPAPTWKMSDKDRKKLADALHDYLQPGKKSRQEMVDPLAKLVEREVDGHSVFADVEAWTLAAAGAREFNPKAGRKGSIREVEVPPEVHGFPGGVGTVHYAVYLPKDYSERSQYPLLFCLPDTKEWPEADKYIDEQWVKPSSKIAEGFIVVVPLPAAKGDAWSKPTAYARAMIALRHAMGTFDIDRRVAGPSTDIRRVFIAGDDIAALIAARFAEMFDGAVLFGCDGHASGGPNLLKAGGLSRLAACVIRDPKKKTEDEFAAKIKADNPASVVHDTFDADATAEWMAARPPVGPRPKIAYTIHDPSFQRMAWINVLAYDAGSGTTPAFVGSADRTTNEVRVEVTGVSKFELFLNDALVDLSKEVRVVVVEGEKEYEFFKDIPARDLGVLLDELAMSNHPWRIYPVRFLVDLPQLRAKQAQLEQKEAASKPAEDEAKKKGASSDAALGR